MVLFDVPALSAMEQALLERPDRHEGYEHQHRSEDPDSEKPKADDHAHGRDDPDGGCGREAPDVGAVPEDGAGAEEADPGDDLRGDARRVCAACEERLEAHRSEQARANAHQGHGADAGRVAVVLALSPDRDGEDQGDDDTKGEIQIAAESQRR
jgi:hypothetical protein